MTKSLVVPGSYHPVESVGQSWQIFRAFFDGFVLRADIIVFIFIVGGAFYIIQKTQAMETGIRAFTDKARGGRSRLITCDVPRPSGRVAGR